ncbi:MAG: hypothetical protein ABSA86_13070 [Oryzomonas sp.]|jgi:hypothetical protein
MKWQMFPFFRSPQAELFIAAAGAIAGQHRLAVMMFFPATFGNVILVMVVLVFQLIQATATGMIGSPFG